MTVRMRSKQAGVFFDRARIPKARAHVLNGTPRHFSVEWTTTRYSSIVPSRMNEVAARSRRAGPSFYEWPSGRGGGAPAGSGSGTRTACVIDRSE